MRIAASLFAAAALAAASAPAEAALYGLVVGVDNYSGVAPLRGAVNDATDIAEALRGAGAVRVETLFDERAQRDALFGAWTGMLAGAASGDTIVFSFAGHGAQEPDDEATKDEADGLDEVFLLQGFSEDDDAGFANKLRDDDLNRWAKDAEARGVNLIYVVDACHSGVPVRAIDSRLAPVSETYTGFRFTRYRTRPTSPARVDDPNEIVSTDYGENITALGATDESLRVREMLIEGRPRGALSWAFARAVEGAADRNHDNAIASDELVEYVRHTVLDQARHNQIPQFQSPTRSTRLITIAPDPETAGPQDTGGEQTEVAEVEAPEVVDSNGANGQADVVDVPEVDQTKLETPGIEKPQVQAAKPDLPTLTVFAPGAALERLGLDGVTQVSDPSAADLVWDPQTGDLLATAGDVLAFAIGERDLGRAIDAQRVRRAISQYIVAGKGLDVELLPGDGLHCTDDKVIARGASKSYTHYTAFDLTGAGEIQFLWPFSRYNDRVKYDPDEVWEFETKVTGPYGTDAVVLIGSDAPLTKLHAMLELSSAALDPKALWKLIEGNLRNVDFEIAVQDIFTRDRAKGSEQCG